MTQSPEIDVNSTGSKRDRLGACAVTALETLGALRPDEVRIFYLDATEAGLVEQASAFLNSAEQRRAEAFRTDSWRSRTARLEFIVGRGWLRLLLAASAGGKRRVDPVDLPIKTASHGKPFVDAATIGLMGLPDFNVAHSHGQVMIALSQAGPVGIDLERVDPAAEVLEISRASFAPVEMAAIERMTQGAEQVEAFYRFWTAKEAVAKADGRGLSLALNSFVVTDAAEGRVALPAREGFGQPTYSVRQVRAVPGYFAALATAKREVCRCGWQIETYDGVIRLRMMEVDECRASAPEVTSV